MALFNIKSKIVGDTLTLTIDLSKDNGATEKGNKLKVAHAFWNDAIPGLPEGHSMSFVMLKPLATKKTAKKTAKVADEEKPTLAKKANMKSAPVAAAKKTTKKTAKVEDNTNEEDVFAPRNKKRAA